LVAIRPHKDAENIRIVIKGAPEYILPMCLAQLSETGYESSMSLEEQVRVLEMEIIGKCAKKGLKTIAYAYKDISYYEWDLLKKNQNMFSTEKDRLYLEKDFTFVAAFGLNDDLREGVHEAIMRLNEGEINVRMISGDNMYTAIDTAKKAGIIRDGEEKTSQVVMNGDEFRNQVGGVTRHVEQDGKEKYRVNNK